MTQSGSPAPSSPAPACWTDVLAGICIPLRLELGSLFLLAAFNKLKPPNGPQLFSASVEAFKLNLDDIMTRLATSATPWIEVVASICLILGLWTRAAACVLAALTAFFIVLLASALIRHLNVDCGCFGDMSPFCGHKVGMCQIVQDALMLAAALTILLTPRHRLAITK